MSATRITRGDEVAVLKAWDVLRHHRGLELVAALGTLDLAPAVTVGDALRDTEARAELLRDLDAHKRDSAAHEEALVACFTAHVWQVSNDRTTRWP